MLRSAAVGAQGWRLWISVQQALRLGIISVNGGTRVIYFGMIASAGSLFIAVQFGVTLRLWLWLYLWVGLWEVLFCF